jgi:hypothetical protein
VRFHFSKQMRQENFGLEHRDNFYSLNQYYSRILDHLFKQLAILKPQPFARKGGALDYSLIISLGTSLSIIRLALIPI